MMKKKKLAKKVKLAINVIRLVVWMVRMIGAFYFFNRSYEYINVHNNLFSVCKIQKITRPLNHDI